MATFSVEEVSPIQRRIRAEIAPEQVAVALEQVFKQLARRVQLPGFRAGKVPRRIIETRFKGEALNDALQQVVSAAYQEALDKHPKLNPVSMPEVTPAPYEEGKPFSFEAVVEVKPELNPSRLEGMELKDIKIDVAETQVDAEIDRVRQQLSRLAPVEGRTVLAMGDYALVDFEATIDGKAFPGSKTEGATFEVNEGEVVRGRMPQVDGLEVGAARTFDYTFPADHQAEHLKGKTARFVVTLKGIQAMQKPELDDAFAKSMGDFADLAAFRARVREDLTTQARQEADRERKRALVTQLLDRNPFDAPRAMIERTMDDRIREILTRLQQQGLDPSKAQIDFEKLRESLRSDATRDLKAALMFDAIAEQQKLTVSEAEIDEKVNEILARVGLKPEDAKRHFGDSERSALRLQIREEKAVAFLVSKANIS